MFNDREGFNIQLSSTGPTGKKDANFDVMLQILSDHSDVLPEDPTNPLLAGEGRLLRHTRVETRSIPDQVGDARNGRIATTRRPMKSLGNGQARRLLITAGYYFWTSGSVEQRCQAGLLRCLLFKLLQEHRHLIPITFPKTSS